MAVVNGKNDPAADGKILLDYLKEKGYPDVGVAAEVNRRIIDRDSFNEYVIGRGDVIEIVSFVGGG